MSKSARLRDGRWGGYAYARVRGETCSYSAWELVASANHYAYVGTGAKSLRG